MTKSAYLANNRKHSFIRITVVVPFVYVCKNKAKIIPLTNVICLLIYVFLLLAVSTIMPTTSVMSPILMSFTTLT